MVGYLLFTAGIRELIRQTAGLLGASANLVQRKRLSAQPAIYRNALPGNVVGAVAGEERHALGNIACLRGARHWHGALHRLGEGFNFFCLLYTSDAADE